MRRSKLARLGLCAILLAAAEFSTRTILSAQERGPIQILKDPVILDSKVPEQLPPAAQLETTDRPLAINLATALRLAGARPVIINAAESSLDVAAAELARARSLWLPSVYIGAGYYHHDGATQGQSGNFYINSKDQFIGGGGLKALVSGTDALFEPLAARQVVQARQFDIQVARNDALLAVAQSYFAVQRARGQLAGAQDVVDKVLELGKKVRGLKVGIVVSPVDLHRALGLRADFEQSVANHREAWRIASADLTQVLRLDPAAIVSPLEPPHTQVHMISAQISVDALIPVGLTNRPELAAQQALVQAALARIRQERMRPLVPSLVLEGGPGSVGPGGYFMGGVFASGVGGVGNPTGGRDDVSIALVWGLENMGFGNRALVRQRQAERQQQLIELFRIQDLVAGDVARAHAQLESASTRLLKAETGLQEDQIAYAGSIKGLGEVITIDNTKLLLQRTLEVITSLQALAKAYDNFFASVNDYNVAQFRLYRALGYPADILSCAGSLGEIHPVNSCRPPEMAPVCSPEK